MLTDYQDGEVAPHVLGPAHLLLVSALEDVPQACRIIPQWDLQLTVVSFIAVTAFCSTETVPLLV